MPETSFLSDDEIILAEFVDESSSSLATLDTLFVELEKAPSDDKIINAIFRPIHSLKANSAFLGLMSLKNLSHTMESLLDGMRKKELAASKPLISALLQGVDELKAITERVRNKQGEVADAARFRSLMDRLTAVKTGQPLPEAAPEAAAEAKTTPGSDGSPAEAAKMVRVPTVALDTLDVVIGELSAIHAEVGGLVSSCAAAPLSEFGRRIAVIHARLDKSLGQFKVSIGAIRKEPLQNLLQKAPRIVRDLVTTNGKKVSLSIRGGQVLAGRQVIQALDAPLVHIIRNAVDHGAEPPDERVKAGKPAECALAIQVNELPGELIIKISDDGKGIDFRALLMKAIKMGVFKPEDQQPTPTDIANLIFLPGLSTAKQVTDISGRGFGMDIVKESIQKLGGKIEVFSKPGKGTDFLIVVPNP